MRSIGATADAGPATQSDSDLQALGAEAFTQVLPFIPIRFGKLT